MQVPESSISSMFESNKRDTSLTLQVGLWDKKGLFDPAGTTIRDAASTDNELLELPGFLEFDEETLRLHGIPVIDDVGIYEIVYRATDVDGDIAEV